MGDNWYSHLSLTSSASFGVGSQIVKYLLMALVTHTDKNMNACR